VQQGRLDSIVVDGGAIIGDDQRPRGSAMILNLPDRESVEARLAADVYSRERVWGRSRFILYTAPRFKLSKFFISENCTKKHNA
jgi:hypothetical protein